MTRRNFIKSLLKTLFLISGVKSIINYLFASEHLPEKYYWNMALDIERWIGGGRCVQACKNENNVPEEAFYFRTWVERYLIKENGAVKIESPDGGMNGFPQPEDKDIVKGFFVPKLCNQCDNSPCIQVCPVGASYKTIDGVIMVDKNYCIGCRYCIQACPYGS